jgi:hypothetical protein
MIVQNPWIGGSGPNPKQNRKPQGAGLPFTMKVDVQGSAKHAAGRFMQEI